MTRHTTLSLRLLGVLAAASVTGIASAQLFSDAEINFIGVSGSSLQYSTNFGGGWSGDQAAGFMHWDPVNAVAVANLTNYGGRTDSDFDAICGQLEYLNDPQLVNGWLSNNGSLDINIRRAGAVVGDNYLGGGVNSFFHARTIGTALNSTAFQAAVWAGRYGGGLALDMVTDPDQVRVGAFYVRKGAGVGVDAPTWAAFKTAMSGYYNSAYNHSFNGVSLFLDGHAQTGSTQDQFTVLDGSNPVPEPFTMALGAASLGLALRRRLRKHA